MTQFPKETITPTLSELVKLQAKVTEIQHLKRKTSPASLSGNLISKFKGQGLEFSQVRKYYPGDDIRSIDWKVTARTGSAFVKEFQVEKESEIAIISNVGPEMQYATFGKFKYLVACDIIALLCFAASYNREKITAYFFGSNIGQLTMFRQKNQKTIVSEILSFLTKKQSLQVKNSDNNLLNSLKEFNVVNKSNGIAFILCDFSEINKEIINEIKHIKTRKTVYLCHIYDSSEKALPDVGNITFSDFGNKRYTIDSSDKKSIEAYAQLFAKRQKSLEELAKDPKIELVNILTDLDPLRQLTSAL